MTPDPSAAEEEVEAVAPWEERFRAELLRAAERRIERQADCSRARQRR